MLYRSATDFDSWRSAARPLLQAGVAADRVTWTYGDCSFADPPETDSVGTAALPAGAGGSRARVTIPHALLRLLETISYHRHAGRWELMYRLAWRAATLHPRLLEDAADPDVHAAVIMERAVNRSCHKMHAFVRFRELVAEDASTTYFAWFEPDHPVLRRACDFFVKRFPNMPWTIATPDGAATWQSNELRHWQTPHDPPLPSRDAPRPKRDEFEDLWRLYYRSICNVARINVTAMRREMPQRYWRHLPEAHDIGPLVREGLEKFNASQRRGAEEEHMSKAVSRALARLTTSDSAIGGEAMHCRRCPLWQHATQAVLGQGPVFARIMLVGEQPGDSEDLRGEPFIGPAGKILDAALESAGMDRRRLFVTNAVKHFKWEPRGKRRLHKKPNVGEISACSVWLEQEIAAIKPAVIVALGATALRALTGRTTSIDAARRDATRHAGGALVVATYHPSAILRADERAEELRQMLADDLTRARRESESAHGS